MRPENGAGVQVKILIDDHGGSEMPEDIPALWKQSGCQLEWFRRIRLFQFITPWELLSYNYRNHRRILVIDGKSRLYRRPWSRSDPRKRHMDEFYSDFGTKVTRKTFAWGGRYRNFGISLAWKGLQCSLANFSNARKTTSRIFRHESARAALFCRR